MRAFSELFEALDTTTSINEKLAALIRYFRSAPSSDAVWAIYFLSGRRLKRLIGSATLRAWLLQETQLPEWLLEETYAEVGDLAETIALLVDSSLERSNVDLSLDEWLQRLLSVQGREEHEQRALVARV